MTIKGTIHLWYFQIEHLGRILVSLSITLKILIIITRQVIFTNDEGIKSSRSFKFWLILTLKYLYSETDSHELLYS